MEKQVAYVADHLATHPAHHSLDNVQIAVPLYQWAVHSAHHAVEQVKQANP
jgi:hypothetical protein